MADRTLYAHLDVHIDAEQDWDFDLAVPVPPDYTEQDIPPFILHELDSAMARYARENFIEGARSADIIHSYVVRARVIEFIIRHWPHKGSAKGLGAAIRAVLTMDNDTLHAKYGDYRLEH